MPGPARLGSAEHESAQPQGGPGEPAPPEVAAAVSGGVAAAPFLPRLPEPPPAVPPGWRTGPPDFVGVGTIRSGTSWWHYLIGCHPDVARPAGRPKEVHYFDQFCEAGRPLAAADYYAYFPRPEGRRCGEWTPRYMFDPWTPPLLARLAGEARLLVLLRDPVERIISALTLIARKREQAVDGPVDDAMINREFVRSLYWYQLRGVLEHFPRRQLLVLQYERCVRDTQREAARTFEFLGLDPGRIRLTASHSRPRNATVGPKIKVEQQMDEEAREILRAELRALASHVPEIDQSLWPSASL
jgi:Sulfotransferase domain